VTVIRSRAHRILEPLSQYRDISERKNWPVGVPSGPALDDSECLIGLYINDPSDFVDTILFTDRGLYLLRDASWTRLLYTEIENVVSQESKSDVGGLNILRRDGGEFLLPVRGVSGSRFYDAFEVSRFLNRARVDVDKEG
jgi:hypothetical protein